jgi:hypothetical protein
MSHQWKNLCDTPLTYFSADSVSEDSHLLFRVVSVSESGKLTLPVRELWCKLEGKKPSDNLDFTIYEGHTWDNCDEVHGFTFEEANEQICSGLPWLRSLNWCPPDDVAGSGKWYVTSLVKASPCIWKKVTGRSGGGYYELHEANLRAWLASGGGDADEFDSEEDWWCLTHNSSDEGPDKTVKKKLPPPDSDDDDDASKDDGDEDEEMPSGFDRDEQFPDGDEDEEPAEPVEEEQTSGGVDDDESSKNVDKIQILDEDALDDDTEDGGVRLSPDQMKPARRFNFTLAGCETEATDDGYDGDA